MGFYGANILNNQWKLGQFEVMSGYPLESWTRDGFQAVAKIKVAYNQRFLIAHYLKGGLNQNGDRERPMQYTPFPLAVCTSVDIGPMDGCVIEKVEGGELTTNPFDYADGAVLTATFETVPWEGAQFDGAGTQAASLNVHETLDGSAEFVTMPPALTYWDEEHTEALAEADSGGKIERMGTWNLTFENAQLALVPNTLHNNVGMTNSDRVLSRRYGTQFEVETLLWTMPRLAECAAADGVPGVNIDLPILWKPEGWNKLWKPGTDFASKYPVYDETGAVKRYYPPVSFLSTLTMFETWV